MRAAWMDRTADAVPVVLSIVIGAIVIAPAMADPALLLVSVPAWAAIYLVYLASLAVSTLFVERLPWVVVCVAFGVMCVAAIAAVVAAPGAGWIMITLVFSALVSGYLLPVWGSVGIVVVNSAVIFAVVSTRGSVAEGLLSAVIYTVLQANAVLFVRVFLHERSLRAEIEAQNVALRATRRLLEQSSRSSERLRISRDLHDVLGHRLTALSLELEAALHTAPDASRAHTERARDVARELLSDVRSTVGELRASDDDLEAALASIVAGVGAIRVDLRVETGPVRDPAVIELLVRAVQEVVTNTLRHASATALRVTVRRGADGGVELEATDDGEGAREVRPGNGLTGMRERVEALGGALRVDGRDGFRVVATIPVAS